MEGAVGTVFLNAEMEAQFGDSSGFPHVYVLNGDWGAYEHPLTTLYNGSDVYVQAADGFSYRGYVRVNYLVAVSS